MSQQLYYFNPGHEGAILNGSAYYMTPANITNMQHELAYLPAWYANPKDYILLPQALPDTFKDFLSANLTDIAQSIVSEELIDNILPLKTHFWGISPQAIHYFTQLKAQYSLSMEIPEWNNNLYLLSSRETAKECLKELIRNIPSVSSSILPQFCTSLDEITDLVENSNYQLLAKAPYSSSGRGLLWLPVDGLTRTEKQILHGILKKQGKVSIERGLNKKIDFAMEFIISENIVTFEGYSLFETNSKGAYRGNYLGSQTKIINRIVPYIDIELLNQVKDQLISILQTKFKDAYTGCIGVDMMIYEEDGSFLLHPCVELNVRDNMGLLAIRLFQNYMEPTSQGFFYIDFSNKEQEIFNRDIQLKQQYPILFANNKIKSGYLSLCPIHTESKYRAYILVEDMTR